MLMNGSAGFVRKSPLKSMNGSASVTDSPVKIKSKSAKRRIESDSEDEDIQTIKQVRILPCIYNPTVHLRPIPHRKP